MRIVNCTCFHSSAWIAVVLGVPCGLLQHFGRLGSVNTALQICGIHRGLGEYGFAVSDKLV